MIITNEPINSNFLDNISWSFLGIILLWIAFFIIGIISIRNLKERVKQSINSMHFVRGECSFLMSVQLRSIIRSCVCKNGVAYLNHAVCQCDPWIKNADRNIQIKTDLTGIDHFAILKACAVAIHIIDARIGTLTVYDFKELSKDYPHGLALGSKIDITQYKDFDTMNTLYSALQLKANNNEFYIDTTASRPSLTGLWYDRITNGRFCHIYLINERIEISKEAQDFIDSRNKSRIRIKVVRFDPFNTKQLYNNIEAALNELDTYYKSKGEFTPQEIGDIINRATLSEKTATNIKERRVLEWS